MQATWEGALAQLSTDPRFTLSALPVHARQQLFAQHVSALREKALSALHALFAAHTQADPLNTPFTALPLSALIAAPPVQKLGLDDAHHLEDAYARWRGAKRNEAERAFQAMLGENAFVEFWGRVRKDQMTQKGREDAERMGVKMDDDDIIGEEEGEEEGEKVDLKALARGIDVREIEKVLRNDRRYTVFDHIPDVREKWIRDHLERLAAPKLSVHVPEHA